MDLVDLFEQASAWTGTKIERAKGRLDSPTPCDEWDVRTVVNHLLQTARYFTASALGEQASWSDAPDLTGGDPIKAFEDARRSVIEAFRRPGVLEKRDDAGNAPLEIILGETLVHGWDIAKGTDQDATMPPEIAEAAWQMFGGRMSDDQRGDFFKAAIPVPDDAPAQDKLLAEVGRQP